MGLDSFGCVHDGEVFVARTGYTGEDGWEIILDVESGRVLWDAACAAGLAPCGLGARDTLRLEAGLNLYGQDMTTRKPHRWYRGLGGRWRGNPNRGNSSAGPRWRSRNRGARRAKLVGLVLDDRGIMRHGQRVVTDAGDGIVTSGGFSPTSQCSIALARVPQEAADRCQVEIRNAMRSARIVRPPFVRKGVINI